VLAHPTDDTASWAAAPVPPAPWEEIMSNDRDDAQGPQERAPIGRQAGEHPGQWQEPSGRSPYDQPAYDQPAYGAAPYGQPQYGQPPPVQYGQPEYGQPQYGQPQYGQPQYGQPQYGQHPPAQYGQPSNGQAPPSRPGTVVTAAVLGLVHGALGLLVTVGLLAGGALIDDLVGALAETDPSIDPQVAASSVDDVRAALAAIAVLALAWTVVMVWGSVLAVRGRSRVLLLVGASIAVATTALFLVFGLVGVASSPGESGQAGGVLFLLALFLVALAMLVLLCLRSAGQFFAGHRQRRSLAGR
jgi:hypothetical protein